jgi:hypothetical protein
VSACEEGGGGRGNIGERRGKEMGKVKEVNKMGDLKGRSRRLGELRQGDGEGDGMCQGDGMEMGEADGGEGDGEVNSD